MAYNETGGPGALCGPLPLCSRQDQPPTMVSWERRLLYRRVLGGPDSLGGCLHVLWKPEQYPPFQPYDSSGLSSHSQIAKSHWPMPHVKHSIKGQGVSQWAPTEAKSPFSQRWQPCNESASPPHSSSLPVASALYRTPPGPRIGQSPAHTCKQEVRSFQAEPVCWKLPSPFGTLSQRPRRLFPFFSLKSGVHSTVYRSPVTPFTTRQTLPSDQFTPILLSMNLEA